MNSQEFVKSKNKRCRWQVAISEVAKRTRNSIREVIENLHFEPNPEKSFIPLSIGDPTIFGNLKPAEEIIAAVTKSVQSYDYNGYAPSAGYDEARQAVAKYSASINGVTVDPKDVILCSGCSGAIDICITAIASRGQNILIPRPGFSIYSTIGEGLGIEFRFYNLVPTKGWEVDLLDLESKIDHNTAAIVVLNPSNPCGSVYSSSHLHDILQIAARNYVPIIADEIYEHIVYPNEKYVSIAALSENVPILSCSGLSKRFLVPGWRVGWITVHDRHSIFKQELRKGLQNLSQRIMGSNTIVQGALKLILESTPNTFYEDLISTLHENAQTVYRMLSQAPGLTPIMPQGAMYIMVGIDMKYFADFENSLDFVKNLVEEQSVFCLPGECFNFTGYMRLVLTLPQDLIKEACDRIAEFCLKYYKKHGLCL